MAISITDTPATRVNSGDPIIWTFQSNQTAQPNFSYLVEIYVNDVIVQQDTVFPEFGIYGKYDASAIFDLYCSSPNPTKSLFIDAGNHINGKIRVTERYGDPIASELSATSSNVLVVKGKKINGESYTALPIAQNSSSEMLNLQPTNLARLGEDVFFMGINDGEDWLLNITLFDADGNEVEADSEPIATAGMNVVLLNLSSTNIIASTSLTLPSFEQASTWEVLITESTGVTIIFKKLVITKDERCLYSTGQRLHFVSQQGAIESYNFNLITRKRLGIESFGMKRRKGYWDTDNTFISLPELGTDIDLQKLITKNATVFTDYLTEDEYTFLIENMATSLLIWINMTAELFRRVKITNTETDYKIGENDILMQFVANINLGSDTTMRV